MSDRSVSPQTAEDFRRQVTPDYDVQQGDRGSRTHREALEMRNRRKRNVERQKELMTSICTTDQVRYAEEQNPAMQSYVAMIREQEAKMRDTRAMERVRRDELLASALVVEHNADEQTLAEQEYVARIRNQEAEMRHSRETDAGRDDGSLTFDQTADHGADRLGQTDRAWPAKVRRNEMRTRQRRRMEGDRGEGRQTTYYAPNRDDRSDRDTGHFSGQARWLKGSSRGPQVEYEYAPRNDGIAFDNTRTLPSISTYHRSYSNHVPQRVQSMYEIPRGPREGTFFERLPRIANAGYRVSPSLHAASGFHATVESENEVR